MARSLQPAPEPHRLAGHRPGWARSSPLATPGPADVLLVVEVADTTLAWDREVKIPLYGRSGIPEVWIFDLTAEAVDVLANPGVQGYAEAGQAFRGEVLRIMGTAIGVDEILG